jgi:hypothetical protein
LEIVHVGAPWRRNRGAGIAPTRRMMVCDYTLMTES